jgi:hypothetical protein
MTPQYLDSFPKWFAANKLLLAECNAGVDLSQPSPASGKRSLFADVDFDGGEIIGRITIWESGECEMEAVYPSTGNWIWGESHTFNSIDQLNSGLHRFFIQLKKVPQVV